MAKLQSKKNMPMNLKKILVSKELRWQQQKNNNQVCNKTLTHTHCLFYTSIVRVRVFVFVQIAGTERLWMWHDNNNRMAEFGVFFFVRSFAFRVCDCDFYTKWMLWQGTERSPKVSNALQTRCHHFKIMVFYKVARHFMSCARAMRIANAWGLSSYTHAHALHSVYEFYFFSFLFLLSWDSFCKKAYKDTMFSAVCIRKRQTQIRIRIH